MNRSQFGRIPQATVSLLQQTRQQVYQQVLPALPPNAPQIQIDECRWAFFAGAQHLFASIISIMDADAEPTANDLRRMDQIHAELQKFAKELELRVESKGKA